MPAMRPAAVVAATRITELSTAQTRNSRRAKVMEAPRRDRSLFFILLNSHTLLSLPALPVVRGREPVFGLGSGHLPEGVRTGQSRCNRGGTLRVFAHPEGGCQVSSVSVTIFTGVLVSLVPEPSILTTPPSPMVNSKCWSLGAL